MTYKEVATMLSEVGIPTAYYQFPDDTPQKPPFICFFYPNSNDVIADNTNYQKVEHLAIELYTDNKDFELEQTLEGVLSSHELVYSRSEEYLDTERMFFVLYETEVIITAEPATEETTNGE